MIKYWSACYDETYPNSIFKFKRDLAKVLINFIDTKNNTTIAFEGIINDEATRQDFVKLTVKFKILSFSSVFRRIKVPGNTVPDTTLFSQAIKNILNVTDVTALLNFDENNINVDLDLPVDEGSVFDNRTVQKALNDLLVASNSVLIVDQSGNIIVKPRPDLGTAITKTFFGGAEILGRENTIAVKKLNTGLHRVFNNIFLNGQLSEDIISVNDFGARQKALDFSFITDIAKATAIADRLLKQFKDRRTEAEITTATEGSNEVELTDLVVIDITPAIRPGSKDKYLPIYGVAKYNQNSYPITSANIPLRREEVFEVIGIFKDPKKFLTTFKIRSTGRTLKVLPGGPLPVYGQGIYDKTLYQ